MGTFRPFDQQETELKTLNGTIMKEALVRLVKDASAQMIGMFREEGYMW
jgi:hypothetical protein